MTPYRIEKLDSDKTLIRFDQWVTDDCTERDEDAFKAALSETLVVAFDLHQTDLLGSDWWRLMGRLGGIAARTGGQRVVAVGVSPVLKRTADAVAASEFITFVDDLSSAWG